MEQSAATLILCSNSSCSMRLACERGHREPVVDQNYESFTPNEKRCDWFLVREALMDERAIFRHKEKRPKHNRHAPFKTNVSHNYPIQSKANDLLAQGRGVLPKAPDLMVSRHIVNGRNVKGDD